MYHDVVSGDPDASGFPGPGPAHYKLPWTTFIAHLDGISRAVEGPPKVADDLLAARKAFSSWSLTFDDGGASMFDAGEELARRKWRGHFFIITNFVGESGFLDTSAIQELRRMGHVIGSHSLSHPARMSSLSEQELMNEWHTSLAALSEILGEKVRTASVPEGYYTRRVADAARRAGIAALFTSEPVRSPSWVGGCIIIGRLSIRRNTNAREAASAAAGRSSLWLRQYAGWNFRKPVKAILGEDYEQLVGKLRPGWNG
jgi:peptidoglycan/xylan/chitin deacetylase (PgdA/CDA1 family)